MALLPKLVPEEDGDNLGVFFKATLFTILWHFQPLLVWVGVGGVAIH